MTKVAEMNATLEIDIAQSVGEKLSLPTHKVKAVTNLLDEGPTRAAATGVTPGSRSSARCWEPRSPPGSTTWPGDE